MSRIWIPGVNGNLGSAFCKVLGQNHDILETCSYELDISDRFKVYNFAKAFKPEIIINCAGYTNIDKAEEDIYPSWKANVDGPTYIAEAANRVNAKAIYISSSYVFSGSNASFSENDRPKPINHYGFTKYTGEQRFSQIIDNGIIIRTSWIFSEQGKNFVTKIISLLNQEDELQLISDQFGCPTYAFDFVDIANKLIFDEKINNGIFHITNSGSTNWYDFTSEIYKYSKKINLINKDVKITPIKTSELNPPRRARRPKNSILNTNRIEEYLGVPLRSWKESIKECLNNRKIK